ncbi:MAG: OB-fold nucleic acid binding domain-containing protein [Anaerolineae bacterium]|nr:OB-fold nucleic acid binding domain-containing protein [Anaerolineae bacterium]
MIGKGPKSASVTVTTPAVAPDTIAPDRAIADDAIVDDRMHCGSCGRFVGPYERCPYCGAQMTGRLAVRTVKLVAALLGTLGLALVWWAARGVPIPEISIGEAGGTMNLAYVRLQGRLTRGLTYDPESGYLGFWLADETGEVHVNAYEDVTRVLLAQGKVPAIGDEVSVAGTLRIREDYVALTLNVPEHLDLQRPAAILLGAGEITLLDEGLRVRVRGHVQQITEPYDGLILVDVRDDSGEITIAVDEAVEALTGELPEMVTGQAITVAGTVSLYGTTPQIVPADVADIQLSAVPVLTQPSPPAVDNPPAENVLPVQPQVQPPVQPPVQPQIQPPVQLPVALTEISEADLGRTVRVQGRVVMLEGLAGGVKATLDDGTAQILLLLWDDVHRDLEAPATLDIGAEVAVTGEVQIYREELEVVPAAAKDVEILKPAELPPWVELGDLSATDAGRVVRARGVLREPQGFSAGVKVVLEDGTGDIVVLFWSQLYQTLAPAPQAGQQVEVVGVIDVFNDELELVPRSNYDWHVRRMED